MLIGNEFQISAFQHRKRVSFVHGRALRSSRSATSRFAKTNTPNFKCTDASNTYLRDFTIYTNFPSSKNTTALNIISYVRNIQQLFEVEGRIRCAGIKCFVGIKQFGFVKQFRGQIVYIRSMEDLYRSWMTLRFNLKAAVTRPVSGDQISETSVTAWGISNFCSPDLTEWFCISVRVNFSTCGWLQSSSKVFNSMPSKQKCHC